MKNILLVASIFLTATASMNGASAPADSNAILIPIVSFALKQLEQKLDLPSQLAAYEFKKSILDPKYEIKSPSLIKHLQAAGLMNENGIIDQGIKDAMKGRIIDWQIN